VIIDNGFGVTTDTDEPILSRLAVNHRRATCEFLSLHEEPEASIVINIAVGMGG
jgi:hypothetical protein